MQEQHPPQQREQQLHPQPQQHPQQVPSKVLLNDITSVTTATTTPCYDDVDHHHDHACFPPSCDLTVSLLSMGTKNGEEDEEEEALFIGSGDGSCDGGGSDPFVGTAANSSTRTKTSSDNDDNNGVAAVAAAAVTAATQSHPFGSSTRTTSTKTSDDNTAAGSMNTSVHSGQRISHLQSNLMRTLKSRDPLKIYEVLEVLGEGSMGRVCRVVKRKEAVGGSARPAFVLHQKTGDCCFPFLKQVYQWFPQRTSAFAAVYYSSSTTDNNNSNGRNNNSSSSSSHNSNHSHHHHPLLLGSTFSTSAELSSNTPRYKNTKSTTTTSGGGDSTTAAATAATTLTGSSSNGGMMVSSSSLHCSRRTATSATSNTATSATTTPTPTIKDKKGRQRTLKKKSSLITTSMDSGSQGGGSSSSNNKQVTYALKSIHLSRCSSAMYVDELKNEVEILKGLDHPNIVRAIETYDYKNHLYIVLELCNGGDLYAHEPYTEAAARTIMTQLLSAVSYLHNHRGIVHRDLKFENIMFVNKHRHDDTSYEIKLIDFGLSQKFAKEEHLHDPVGTVYTMAPELLQGDYTSQADVWSCGVIAFMLLSSSMPFYGQTRVHVIKKILHGSFRFAARRWKTVSKAAKDFCKACLTLDPDGRPTAQQAAHSMAWFLDNPESPQQHQQGQQQQQQQQQQLSSASSDTTMAAKMLKMEQMDQIQTSILSFAAYSQLKKLALLIIAYKSTSEEIGFLRSFFGQFDSEGDGEISAEEFFQVLSEHYDYTQEECLHMFQGIDVDGTGKVHYSEFLAATLEAHGSLDETRLAEAFDRLDADDSGYISLQNLRHFLGPEVPEAYIQSVMDEADVLGDHRITYDEFMQLWSTEDDEAYSQTRLAVASRHLSSSAASNNQRTESFVSDISSTGENNNSKCIDTDSSGWGCSNDYVNNQKTLNTSTTTNNNNNMMNDNYHGDDDLLYDLPTSTTTPSHPASPGKENCHGGGGIEGIHGGKPSPKSRRNSHYEALESAACFKSRKALSIRIAV